MTSFRQIDANRRNAQFSTGSVTEEGKRTSRQNAVRHGLTAETVLSGYCRPHSNVFARRCQILSLLLRIDRVTWSGALSISLLDFRTATAFAAVAVVTE